MWAKVNSQNVVTDINIKPEPFNATKEVDLSSQGWYYLKLSPKPQESVELKAVDITKDNVAIVENNYVFQQWALQPRPEEEKELYSKSTLNFVDFRLTLIADSYFLDWQVAIIESPDTVDNLYLNNLRDAVLLNNLQFMQQQYDLLKAKIAPSQEAINTWQNYSKQYLNNLFIA